MADQATAVHDTKTNAAIVYGPQGCGKTRNAAALAKHYGKTLVIEHDSNTTPICFPADALVLTSDSTLEGAIAFEVAMAAAGISTPPQPANQQAA